MPTKLQILAAELTTDPQTRGYDGMTDEEATTDLNTKYRSRTISVSHQELLIWASGNQRIVNVDTAEESGADADVRNRGAAMAAIIRTGSGLDLSRASTITLIDALVSDGTWDAADKTTLLTLGSTPQSRADELGLGQISPGNVNSARI